MLLIKILLFWDKCWFTFYVLMVINNRDIHWNKRFSKIFKKFLLRTCFKNFSPVLSFNFYFLFFMLFNPEFKSIPVLLQHLKYPAWVIHTLKNQSLNQRRSLFKQLLFSILNTFTTHTLKRFYGIKLWHWFFL